MDANILQAAQGNPGATVLLAHIKSNYAPEIMERVLESIFQQKLFGPSLFSFWKTACDRDFEVFIDKITASFTE
jgi:hypothetical protein